MEKGGKWRRVVAVLVTTAALIPLFSFLSSITTPWLRSWFLIGSTQSFTVCNVQSLCERDNQRFETFLARQFDQVIELDLAYDWLSQDWDDCIDQSPGDESPIVMGAFLDVPLFGLGTCTRGRIARIPESVAIENGSLGTGNVRFRIIGTYLVGGTSQMYLLTPL